MQRHGIPTAGYAVFERRGRGACPRRRQAPRRSSSRPTAWPPARAWSSRRRAPRRTRRSTRCSAQRRTAAGARVVIEEFLEGEEASFIVVCDGTQRARRWPPARTTSACGDGDPGPNTGGMGAYSPAPVVTPNVHARVMQEIILPTIAGMAADGMPFTGFLYAGLMIDAHGAAEDGRVQLPPRRPRDAADPDAPEDRPVRAADAGDRARSGTAAGRRRAATGTGASRSAS